MQCGQMRLRPPREMQCLGLKCFRISRARLAAQARVTRDSIQLPDRQDRESADRFQSKVGQRQFAVARWLASTRDLVSTGSVVVLDPIASAALMAPVGSAVSDRVVGTAVLDSDASASGVLALASDWADSVGGAAGTRGGIGALAGRGLALAM